MRAVVKKEEQNPRRDIDGLSVRNQNKLQILIFHRKKSTSCMYVHQAAIITCRKKAALGKICENRSLTS